MSGGLTTPDAITLPGGTNPGLHPRHPRRTPGAAAGCSRYASRRSAASCAGSPGWRPASSALAAWTCRWRSTLPAPERRWWPGTGRLPKAEALAAAGAGVATSVQEVFDRVDTVILILSTSGAMDAVLARGTPSFAGLARDRTLVHMGTTSPGYSRGLAADIRRAGGRYVEAAGAGSRQPVEAGQFVAMLAGDADDVEAVRPLLAPMCR